MGIENACRNFVLNALKRKNIDLHSFILFSFYFLSMHIMVLFLSTTVIYVFLLLCLCILIVCFMYLHRATWHSSATLTEGFPCFFLSRKANARVKPRKDGARPALFQNYCVFLCTVCFVSFCVLFECKCVLY